LECRRIRPGIGRAEAERETAATELADAQAMVAEFATDAPNVEAATVAYERLQAVIAGRLAKADGMDALNRYMREVVARGASSTSMREAPI
jgi:hypothetical protein